MAEHYFTAHEDLDERSFTPEPLRVELAGRSRDLLTAPGIFSPRGIDKGTAVLLAEAPTPVGDSLMDIGCGWGPLALTLGLMRPEAQVTAVDVNHRSLELVRRNAVHLGLGRVTAQLPDQVDPRLGFDTIWSNPPIRVGKEILHGILITWLPRLNPGGSAYLVVQKNLGADSLLRWLDRELPEGLSARRHAAAKGFRLLEVSRTGRTAAS